MGADAIRDNPILRAQWAGRLRDNRFVGAVATLQIGSLLVSAVSFGASVVLARALGASDFGLLALVVTTGTTVGLLRRLGQDYAATSRAAEGYAVGDVQRVRDALVFYVWMSVVTSIVVLPIGVALSPTIGVLVSGEPRLGELLPLYFVQGFWAVVAGLSVVALQSTRRVGALVRFETPLAVLATTLPVFFVLVGLGLVGALGGQIVASLIGLVVGLATYRRLARVDALLPHPRELLWGVIRPGIALWRETRFGLSIALDKNLVSLSILIPFLLLGALAAESDVGQLRVAVAYMAIPAVLLAPVSRLLMVDIPRLRSTDPAAVRPFFLRVTTLGLLASSLLAIPFALAAVWVVPWFYGDEFRGAPMLTFALLLDAATLGAGIAAGPVFRAYDRTDLPIVASVVLLLFGLPSTYLAIGAWGPIGAALGYAGMLFASRLISYVQCLRIIRA